MAELTKMIAIPVVCSYNAMKSIGYLTLMYGPEHNLMVVKEIFMGSVVRKVLDNCHGLAVWVVH